MKERAMRLMNLTLMAAAALLTACASLPDDKVPSTTLPPRFAQAHGLAEAAAPQFDWWQAIGDPVLSQLIVRGLEANLDLAQAAERVQRSRALVAGARANFGPGGGIRAQTQSSPASNGSSISSAGSEPSRRAPARACRPRRRRRRACVWR
jgi:outer membrane protein TolC